MPDFSSESKASISTEKRSRVLAQCYRILLDAAARAKKEAADERESLDSKPRSTAIISVHKDANSERIP